MGRSILITGCSQGGIGDAVAHALKVRGYRVFATARRGEEVARLHAEGFDAYVLDVTDPETVGAALDAISEQTGGTLDALFNNAGYGQPGALEDVGAEALRAQFETNVIGLHELTRRVIPIMRAQGRGRILQHSSVLGLVSLRFRGAYNASKYAVEGLCDTLRLELMGTNIHIISLNTGPVRSRFRENATAMFHRYIDLEHSAHREEYRTEVLKRREQKEERDRFTRDADVVVDAVIHALESSRPKPRYHITSATGLLAMMKRLLPTALLDRLLRRIQ